MHLGFSYVGLIYLLMLYIPNIIWTKNQPEGYEDVVGNENKILLVFERVGEVLATVVALFFSDFNIRINAWSIWLIISFACMVIYEIYWIRYFKGEKTLETFYGSFLGIPVPGASLPVVAFFLLGIYGSNILMIVTSVILGIGHIGIHLAHAKEAGIVRKKSNIFVRILKLLVIIVLVLNFVLISFVIAARNVRYVPHYANLPKGVEEETYINLCGQDQYVQMMGRDVSNPVIICLHGGPASPDSYDVYAYADKLSDAFTFVCWDQRGCGKTYVKNQAIDPGGDTVSFEQALEDLDALVDYVRDRFAQDKVIILGHSYGTILGSTYVTNHPDKVSAYIAVAQVTDIEDNLIYGYNDALEKAKESGEDVKPLTDAYDAFKKDKNLETYSALNIAVNAYHPVAVADNVLALSLFSPYFDMKEMDWFMLQMTEMDKAYSINSKLLDKIFTFDAYSEKTDYEVPVYFVCGTDDWVCPQTMIEEYINTINAPKKDMLLLQGCGHNCQYSLPDEFAEFIRNIKRF